MNLIDDSESSEGEGFRKSNTAYNHIGVFPRKEVECLHKKPCRRGLNSAGNETWAGMVGILASPRAKINQTEIISPINVCWAIK